ncbi:MAG: UDP-glucose/GDP-mannose dehydrogenase family protein [Candidatus Aminicenantes bacterium]|nr:UDP-glucose/GDP-mannose dehydrogenase family protein [Candidatus Aminicenantes bacterium]
MKISVIGTGYVGLVTAVGLADLGHQVVGTDKIKDKIDRISLGDVPIYEPGLDALLKKNLKKGNLTFSQNMDDTIQAAEVIFVCVGTPQKEDGSADMSQIEEVSRMIAKNLNSYKVVVEKSTVPVKTSMWIKRIISLYRKTDVDFDVASNPEFLREGSAVSDFLNPDRIIIGVESDRARDLLVEIYGSFKDRILITNIDTAELIKHASNSFLAMKISYINMISDLCEKTEADVELVAEGMGLDKRIGRQFLRAGLGYGGSCFPKDIKALARIGEELGVTMSLLKEADKINAARVETFIKKLKKCLWILKDKTIAMLGLSFKPETDDIREAPSIKIIAKLLEEGAFLRLYDPKASENMKSVFPESENRLIYVDNPYQAVGNANALLFITEWDEFKNLDWETIKKNMANPIIIDGRNIFLPEDVRKRGFEYYSIGRR